MEEELKKIRAACDKIESDDRNEKMQFRTADFGRFDLPKHVCDFVDYLQPLLLPNEAAVYWYLFRKSIIQNMDNKIRFFAKDLCKDFEVIGSDRSDFIGIKAAVAAIDGLEKKGVIVRFLKSMNKDGYYFAIKVPSEIPICIERKRVMDEEKSKSGLKS